MSAFEVIALLAALGALVLLIIVVVRLPGGIAAQLSGIDTRLTEVEKAARSAGEAATQARDAKEASLKVASETSEVRGRLSALMDAQGAISESVVAMAPAIKLQHSEGLLALGQSITSGQAAFRQEVSERDERRGRELIGKLDGWFQQVGDALARLRSETTALLRSGEETATKNMSELKAGNDAKLGEIVTRTSDSAKSLNDTAQKTISTVAERLAELKATIEGLAAHRQLAADLPALLRDLAMGTR